MFPEISFPISPIPHLASMSSVPPPPASNLPNFPPEQYSPHELNMLMPQSILEPFRQKVSNLTTQAQAVEIAEASHANTATALAGHIKKSWQQIETARKNYLAPLNAHVKEVNNLAKALQAPLESAEFELKKKLQMFSYEQKLIQQKLEQEAQKQQAEQQAKLNAEAKTLGVQAPLIPEVLPEPAAKTTIRTEGGTSFIKKSWEFKLTDLALVPHEYLMLDEKKVREAVKAGIREIKGLNIYEQENISIRS